MEIKKVLQEQLPAVKLIGRKYYQEDRDIQGTYRTIWQEWISNNYFNIIYQLPRPKQLNDDLIGLMYHHEGQNEYWVGMFRDIDAPVPAGFESLDIPAGTLAIAYVRGDQNNGELFGHEIYVNCVNAWQSNGWAINPNWVIERYNDQRYILDQDNQVILDYCAFIQTN